MAPGLLMWNGETAKRMTDSENHSAAVISPSCDRLIRINTYRNEFVCNDEFASLALIHTERRRGEKEQRTTGGRRRLS